MATKKPKKTVRQQPAARSSPPVAARRQGADSEEGGCPQAEGRQKDHPQKSARPQGAGEGGREESRAIGVDDGRPRVPGDAKLDLVFRKDHQAREVFAFLGVNTVRDLEKFGPDEIIRRLTGPMVQTVGRIRKAMALCNRALLGDQAFALEFQQRAAAYSQNRE